VATCADCNTEFAGTPWRYNTAGKRVHVNCNDAPPPPALGSFGDPHGNRPQPGWAKRKPKAAPIRTAQTARTDTIRHEQARWRQIAQDHAGWSHVAKSVLKQRYPITPRQGAVLDRLQRQKPRRTRR
jgi:hypothetical protein